ncbi:hypothetical protein FIBSPDRAFT_1054434 [Athelia psychrophila]|uniref:Uncharacterized protein n=1 Tax=Athelia psychrophila TaxID=1759441 RepID=A0A167UIW7_9AGAM|nr:hypothetical protein FIBSPDRAFT_1054961 [Fibularhizoctonia sp. CBS 109695]KZP04823.1 hypothetical protein FIBSPDRAFT_1054434 [Fibularhizoctonia sp. CBS 109695]
MHDDVPVDIGKFMCDARFHIHAYIHSRAQVEHHYFEFISLSRCQFLVILCCSSGNIWHLFNEPLEVDSESTSSLTSTPASAAPPLEPPQQRSVANMTQPVLFDTVDPIPRLSCVTTAGEVPSTTVLLKDLA